MSKNGQGRRRDAIIIYLLGRVDWYPAKAATAVQPAYPNLIHDSKNSVTFDVKYSSVLSGH